MKTFEEQFKDLIGDASLKPEQITALTSLKGQYDAEKEAADRKYNDLNKEYQQTRTDYIKMIQNTHFSNEPQNQSEPGKPKDLSDYIQEAKNKKSEKETK